MASKRNIKCPFQIPSSKEIAPAKTRAAYSPTLNPAVETQFSIACKEINNKIYDMCNFNVI